MAVASAFALSAAAQAYPAKPIRVVVPYAAGGAVDVVGRLLAMHQAEGFGQPVIVDNRPGAGSNIGADLVAKAAPDGYTLLLDAIGRATSPALYRKLPFDSLEDFTPVTQVIATQFVFVSPPSAASSLKDLISRAKAKPGSLNYGSTGVGAAPHLTMALFNQATGTRMEHIPYKGDAPMNAALMSGEIQVAATPISTAAPLIAAGKLKALAVTGLKRSPALPEVPTADESGVTGFEFTSWQGYFMPGHASRDVAQRFYRETARVVALPDVRDRLVGMGSEIVASTPEAFATRYRADVARFLKVVKESGIPLQD